MNFSKYHSLSRMLSLILVLCLVSTLFTGCLGSSEETTEPPKLDLETNPSSTTQSTTPPTTEAAEINENTATVISQINIRSSPSTEANIIGTLNPGDRVEISRREELVGINWAYIISPQAGWIVMEYVKMDIPTDGNEGSDTSTPAGGETTPPATTEPSGNGGNTTTNNNTSSTSSSANTNRTTNQQQQQDAQFSQNAYRGNTNTNANANMNNGALGNNNAAMYNRGSMGTGSTFLSSLAGAGAGVLLANMLLSPSAAAAAGTEVATPDMLSDDQIKECLTQLDTDLKDLEAQVLEAPEEEQAALREQISQMHNLQISLMKEQLNRLQSAS